MNNRLLKMSMKCSPQKTAVVIVVSATARIVLVAKIAVVVTVVVGPIQNMIGLLELGQQKCLIGCRGINGNNIT